MRKFTTLLIIIFLTTNVKSPLFDWDWNWNWNWDFKWKNFLDKFKSTVPDFIQSLQNKFKDFIDKTEEQKNNFIKELNLNVTKLYEKIKEDIKEKKENIETQIKSLIEKTTESSKFLSYKVCDIANIDYLECRNDKKKLFTNLLDIVKENFGECSVIIGQLSKLSDNPEQNLKYFLFMVISLSENPDALEEGKSQIIYDIIHCLKDKFEDYWPSINETILNKELRYNTKLDIINLLSNSFSNLVNIIHFEEIDGYIKKINNVTGLISDEKAKQIHKGIFNLLKKYNEFGSLFHNISANLALDIILNPGNLNFDEDFDFKWIKDDNKGIRINLHANYLLREMGAESIQTVIFESPLVALRETKTDGGVSNTFVGITLYDKEGNEIFVKDIDEDIFRPVIYFKKKLFSAMKTCLFYNEEKEDIDDEGIATNFEILDGEEYIKCIPKHFTSFTIGSFKNETESNETEETNINDNNIINTSIINSDNTNSKDNISDNDNEIKRTYTEDNIDSTDEINNNSNNKNNSNANSNIINDNNLSINTHTKIITMMIIILFFL